ncbi:hypothetical protein JR316_0003886 [Psilocybe cubensis]|uniref:Uncharacterized protein n=1 Tax=Psilocybe cubensis TaxID=181762 RepID=A0ACB8H8S8_PSICU|nr:hypothetical protein JR316_0003886 [Psilocybe cubensis]KAH9484405.1 hypothetical protein JR316_0003886 [Psilocybe cubensis]
MSSYTLSTSEIALLLRIFRHGAFAEDEDYLEDLLVRLEALSNPWDLPEDQSTYVVNSETLHHDVDIGHTGNLAGTEVVGEDMVEDEDEDRDEIEWEDEDEDRDEIESEDEDEDEDGEEDRDLNQEVVMQKMHVVDGGKRLAVAGGDHGRGGGGGDKGKHRGRKPCVRGGQKEPRQQNQALLDVVGFEDVDSRVAENEDEDDVLERQYEIAQQETAEEDRETPENHVLTKSTRALLLKVCSVCDDIMDSSGSLPSFQSVVADPIGLLTYLCNPVYSKSYLDAILGDQSLKSLANRCSMAECNTLVSKFVQVLSLMHFRTKVESEFLQKKKTTPSLTRRRLLEDFWLDGKDKPEPKSKNALSMANNVRKMHDWLKMGSAFCILGGSALPGQLVTKSLIPAISKLGELFDIEFTSMFSPDMLSGYHAQYTSSVSARNLKESDKIFDNINFETYRRKRDWNAWSSFCINDLQNLSGTINDIEAYSSYAKQLSGPTISEAIPSSPTVISQSTSRISTISPTVRCSSPMSILEDIPLLDDDAMSVSDYSSRCPSPLLEDEDAAFPGHIINSTYKSDADLNAKFPFSRTASKQQIFSTTQAERKKAEEAPSFLDFEQFRIQFKKHITRAGIRRGKKYLLLSSDILNQLPLRINDSKGAMQIIVDPTMSSDMRSKLWTNFKVAFGESLVETDSKSQGNILE